MDVIPIVTTLNLIFQKESLDIGAIQSDVSTTKVNLVYLKSNIGHHSKECKTLLTDDGVRLGKNLIENLEKRFPSMCLSLVSAFDALAVRHLFFVPQSKLREYGTEKLELLDRYGQPECNHRWNLL